MWTILSLFPAIPLVRIASPSLESRLSILYFFLSFINIFLNNIYFFFSLLFITLMLGSQTAQGSKCSMPLSSSASPLPGRVCNNLCLCCSYLAGQKPTKQSDSLVKNWVPWRGSLRGSIVLSGGSFASGSCREGSCELFIDAY